MREYVVVLTYSAGVHPVRDVFIEHPELLATALDISVSPEASWRIERITGPEDALDELERVYLDPDVCNECVYLTPACDAQSVYETVESEPTARTIYRRTTDESYCHSVSFLAMSTLGTGLVFDAVQRGPYYEWRMLAPEGRDVRAFHRTLQTDLPDGVTFDVRRVGSPEQWQRGRRPGTGTDLPYKQREALEVAVALGYYDHPRNATLEDVAAHLDLPLTTLRYRLRRAEAWAVAVAFGEGPDGTPVDGTREEVVPSAYSSSGEGTRSNTDS